MRNLQESIEGINDHYLESLKNLNRIVDINLEILKNGKTTPGLYGECFIIEDIINAFDVKIKEDSIITIARFQPAAKNLRQLIMFIDGARLVERMADILKTNLQIIKNEKSSANFEEKLKTVVYPFVKNINDIYESYIDAFIYGDETILYELISKEADIEIYSTEQVNKVISFIKEEENNENVESYINLIMLVKKYERFSEHIIHLVVDLVYILKGENLRKKELLELEKDKNNI